MQQNPLTRRRFLVDLICVGGAITLTAGLAMELHPLKQPEEKPLIAPRNEPPQLVTRTSSCPTSYNRSSYNAAGGAEVSPPSVNPRPIATPAAKAQPWSVAQ